MTRAPVTIREFAVAAVPVNSCPIRASLGVLGRKWALLVLRDVAIYENIRFSDLLKYNPGLTPRMLTFRLTELREEGLISRTPSNSYELTEKGRYAIPILTGFINYGIRYHAKTVFPDGKPRQMCELFPHSQCEMLGNLVEYADVVPPAKRASKAPAKTLRTRQTGRAVAGMAPQARPAKTRLRP